MGGSACDAVGLIAWLDCHAGAVQALSAVAIVFLTLVLIGVTGWYAWTTRDLAETTRSAFNFQLDGAAVARGQFLTATRMLQSHVATLEPAISDEFDVRRVRLWPPELLALFDSLAASGGASASKRAIRCGIALRRLGEFVEKVQTLPAVTGYHVTLGDKQRWIRLREAAKGLLEEIEAELGSEPAP